MPTDAAQLTGLRQHEVDERTHAGDVNRAPKPRGRTVGDIVRANVFTIFNAILAVALVVILAVGQWQDAVFGFVLVINTAIGTVAEIRAKKTLDRVAIIDQPTARVIRDGAETEIPAESLVLGDLVRLALGDQVPVDGKVRQANGLTINESILTGESQAKKKRPDDDVLSGSSVVAGGGLIEATAVGARSYANSLTDKVRRYRSVRSELAEGINTILKWLSWIIVPLAVLVMWSQLRTAGSVNDALTSGRWRVAAVLAVAAVVGMIPQGLVLLTSMNFAVAAATLARRGAVVQELPAVEVLARVDTLCLDKTGTLTTGSMQVKGIEDGGTQLTDAEFAALRALVADRTNGTAEAVDDYLREQDVAAPVEPDEAEPFSSDRKYGSITVGGDVWFFGAPEVLLGSDDQLADRARELAGQGSRVVALARGDGDGNRTGRALVDVAEELRRDARTTLRYLSDQGVRLLVISGDNPATAAAVAARVGVADHPRSADARELPSDRDELAGVLEDVDVLGRVQPDQKRDIVKALQARGHVVGMTGDGVNDALALKEADLGIAMGSGTRATKAVARLVLLKDEFGVLPKVLGEGRRVMANMERVSILFLTKTVYALILALAVAILTVAYPFYPRHLTIIGALSIGTPAFFLALAPNDQRYRAGFLHRVLRVVVPVGSVIAVTVLIARTIGRNEVLGGRQLTDQVHTIVMLVTLIIALALLATLATPLIEDGRPTWRAGLLSVMVAGAVAVVVIPPLRRFSALALPNWPGWVLVAVLGALGAAVVWLLSFRIPHRTAADRGSPSEAHR